MVLSWRLCLIWDTWRGTRENKGTHYHVVLYIPRQSAFFFPAFYILSACFCCTHTELGGVELLHLAEPEVLWSLLQPNHHEIMVVFYVFSNITYIFPMEKCGVKQWVFWSVEIISIQIWYIVLGNKNNNFFKTLLIVPHDLLSKNALHPRKCIMRINKGGRREIVVVAAFYFTQVRNSWQGYASCVCTYLAQK